MSDASGRTWIFLDKPPIFTDQVITPTTAFPVDGGIRCEIVSTHGIQEGQTVVEVTTIDVDSVDGQHRFQVKADQVFE